MNNKAIKRNCFTFFLFFCLLKILLQFAMLCRCGCACVCDVYMSGGCQFVYVFVCLFFFYFQFSHSFILFFHTHLLFHFFFFFLMHGIILGIGGARDCHMDIVTKSKLFAKDVMLQIQYIFFFFSVSFRFSSNSFSCNLPKNEENNASLVHLLHSLR